MRHWITAELGYSEQRRHDSVHWWTELKYSDDDDDDVQELIDETQPTVTMTNTGRQTTHVDHDYNVGMIQ